MSIELEQEVFEMEQVDPIVLEAMAAIMTHTLKPKQILRTIVNNIPCSAVIMTDKRIMAVKGINKGTVYDSAEAWTTSLAITSGCATMRGITVDEKLTDDVLGATSAISAISAKEESDTKKEKDRLYILFSKSSNDSYTPRGDYVYFRNEQ